MIPSIRSQTLRLPALLVLIVLAGCGAGQGAPITATSADPPSTTPSPAELPLPTATTAPPSTFTPAASPTPPPTATFEPQAGGRSAGDPYIPELGNTGYDVLHYELALTVDPGATMLAASARITAATTLPGLNEFSLDFIGYEITALQLDGIDAVHHRDGGKLVVQPAQPLAVGQIFELDVHYFGVPVQQGSPYVPFFHHLGFQFLGRSAFAYSQPDGARTWFPCNDHPTDKATFSYAITVPAGLIAVANGVQTGFSAGETEDTFLWEQASPMATYLATVAVGEYEIIETSSPAGIPIRHFVFADIRQPFLDAADVTGEALDWMAELFGPYPFESYGFVTTRLIRAALETQSNVLLSELMLNEETVIHEIVHMWFGNWVSMASWADMWNSEGLAVYISLMWQTREAPGSLNIFMQNLEAEVGREASADPLGDLSPNLLFGFDSYQRGALLIHNLRLTVGDEAFFSGLRVYLERFGGGSATRADFFGVFEEVGGMDLGAFEEEWLE